jgi:beta-lactamase regulating signal transducer with metallopeptidase domain
MLTILFLYSLKSSILLSLFYAVYWLLLRNNTNFQIKRFVLLVILIISIIAPSIKIQSTSTAIDQPFSFQKFDNYQKINETNPDTNLSTAWATDEAAEANDTSAFDWQKSLLTVYATGLILSGLYILYQLFSVLILVYSGVRNVKERNLVKHHSVKHPFSFGKWVFLPLKKEYSSETFNTIIEHEQAHLKQQHSIDVLFFSIFKALTWYNPFVYFFNKSIKYNHECLADKAVLKSQAPNLYAEELLNVAFNTEQFSMAHSFALNSNILNRIKVMKKKTTNLFKTAICLLVITATIALAISQASLVAQDTSTSDNLSEIDKIDQAKFRESIELFSGIKETPTMLLILDNRAIPLYGIPRHLKALELLENEHHDRNLQLSYSMIESRAYPQIRLIPFGYPGQGEIIFKTALTDEDITALYQASIKFIQENILPKKSSYELPEREFFNAFSSVEIS